MKNLNKKYSKSEKKKLILHIGMPKSASTILQTNIFPNILNLKLIDKIRSIRLDEIDLSKTQNQNLDDIRILSCETFFFNFRLEALNKNGKIEQHVNDIIKFNKIHPVLVIIVIRKPSELLKSGYLHIYSKHSLFKKKDITYDKYLKKFNFDFFKLSIFFNELINSSIPFLVIDINDKMFNSSKTFNYLSDILFKNNISIHELDIQLDKIGYSNISPTNNLSFYLLRLEKSFRLPLSYIIKLINKLEIFKQINYDKVLIRDLISKIFNILPIKNLNFKHSKEHINGLDKFYFKEISTLQKLNKKKGIYKYLL